MLKDYRIGTINWVKKAMNQYTRNATAIAVMGSRTCAAKLVRRVLIGGKDSFMKSPFKTRYKLFYACPF